MARRRWRLGVFIGAIIGLSIGLSGELNVDYVGHGYLGITFGIRGATLIGLSFGGIGAIIGGIASGLNQTDLNMKTQPNQSLRQSLWLALGSWAVFGLLVGLGVGASGGLAMGLITARDEGLANGILYGVDFMTQIGLVFSLGFGTAASLYFGGLAFVQHFALRLVCALCGYAPWRYPRFLDYAVERILLRRVGGSYIFVHRLLMEHVAGLTDEEVG